MTVREGIEAIVFRALTLPRRALGDALSWFR
jgi:hypothetical protein